MQTPPGPPPPPNLPPPPPYAQQQPYAQPPPYYTPPYPNATYAPAATDAKATVAMVLGIISVVLSFCYGFGFLFAVPAFILGLAARKAITRSEGALGGEGMAMAGIITGGIGGVISLFYVVVIAGVIAFSASAARSTPHPPPAYAPPTSPSAPSPPVATVSGVNVVDLHTSGGPLRAQIGAEYARASTTHQKLMVMTTAKWSKEALEIFAAFADDEMEEALEDVTVVRVDVEEFKSELRASKLEKTEVPWFFLIGPTLDPSDAISADEWGANDPHSIATVLEKFVQGKLGKRRVAPPKGTAL